MPATERLTMTVCWVVATPPVRDPPTSKQAPPGSGLSNKLRLLAPRYPDSLQELPLLVRQMFKWVIEAASRS